MHQDSSAAAVALVSRIHLLLAERDEQAIDDAKFLNELRALQADIPEPNMVYGISVRIDIDKISPAEFPVASVNSLQFPEIQIPLPV